MVYRCVGLAVAAAILWTTGTVAADDVHFQDLGQGLALAPVARQDGLHRAKVLPHDASGYREASDEQWAARDVPRPLGNRRLPFPPEYQSEWARGTPRAAAWQAPARLPGTESRRPPGQTYVEPQQSPPQPVDGTWRNDGRYLILNVDGRELKLLKESPVEGLAPSMEQERLAGGAVEGCLLHQGRPLVNCQVGLLPLAKSFTGYRPNRSAQPIRVTTDEHGIYRFQKVPAGFYKLAWLPEGTNQWIRRITMRPDAVVRDGETVRLKEIRVALNTLN